MKRFVAVTTSPTGTAHTLMAAEALQKIAASLGHRVKVETPGNSNVCDTLSAEEIAAADVVILAADVRVERARFAKALIEAAVELAGMREADIRPVTTAPRMKKFVAVTVCPDGIAHTFITATSLQKAAKALGHEIKVETQGFASTTHGLTTEEIAAADAVVIAAETAVDTSRFVGKPLYRTSTKHAIHAGQEVLTTTLEHLAKGGDFTTNGKQARSAQALAHSGPYKHLLTGVSYMLPMLIAGGLSLALAFTFSDIYAVEQKEGTFAWALNLIGSGIAFQLFVAMLSGFIAFSIAERSGLVPGLIGGMLAQHLGSGFLGGIASGFLAGYLTKFLAAKIRLPDMFQGLIPVLILPFLSSILVGFTMIYLVAPPVYIVLDALTGWLCSMQGMNALSLGMLLGGMMAFDMGGPVNKAATTFAIGLLASKIYTPMATVMVAGMTPPLGLAAAAWLFKTRFDREEREAAGSTFVLGLSFITEGAIPFAAKDPLRVIPAIVMGAAVSGAVSMFYGVELLVPHGGIFAVVIPGAVKPLIVFFAALTAGTIVTIALLFVLKKPLGEHPNKVK